MSTREIYRMLERQWDSSAGTGTYLRMQPYRLKFKGQTFRTELPALTHLPTAA